MPARRLSKGVIEQLQRDVRVPEPPPAPRRRWWPWVLGAVLMLLYIGGVVAMMVTNNIKAARRKQEREWKRQQEAAWEQARAESWRAEGYTSAEHKRAYEEDYQRRMGEWPARQPEPQRLRTMAQNLLIIDGGGPVPAGDPRLVPYEQMLDLLAARTTSTRQQVGDATATLKQILKDEHGIDMSCLELMGYVANTIPKDGSLKWSYAEFAAMWMTFFVSLERR